MKINKVYLTLIILFLFVLGIRLYYSFSTLSLANDESYFSLRIIQDIATNQHISFYDSLSYGGRELIYSPLFYILFAVFSLGSLAAMKVLSALAFSSLVFIIYSIAFRFTSNHWIAFITTLYTNFIPLFVAGTTNTITPYAFVIPLFFIMFYSWMRLDSKFYLGLFLISSVLLPLLHSSSFLFLLVIILYFFLLSGGALQPTAREKEALLFTFFSVILINLVFYKRALLDYGLEVIWENLPLRMMNETFRSFSTLDLIFSIGLVALFFGLSGLYFGIVKEKEKWTYLLGAFMLGILCLLVLQLIPFSDGLIFLGLSLGTLSAISIKRLWLYSSTLKIRSLGQFVRLVLLVVLPVFIILGTLSFTSNYPGIDTKTVLDFTSLKEMPLGVVAADVYEGHLITTLAGKKNIVDTSFLLAPKPLERLNDLELLYTTGSAATAYGIIDKYKIKVIYLSGESQQKYEIEELKYAKENKCFERKGDIYLVKCTE